MNEKHRNLLLGQKACRGNVEAEHRPKREVTLDKSRFDLSRKLSDYINIDEIEI
jgi:hypothetical protein